MENKIEPPLDAHSNYMLSGALEVAPCVLWIHIWAEPMLTSESSSK